MSCAITEVDLHLTIYGRRQVEYSVDGKAAVDFSSVVNDVTLRQVTAFESEVAAYALVVEKRKAKLEKLGEALSILRRVVGKFKSDAKSDATVSDSDLPTVKSIFATYGVPIDGLSDNDTKITKKGANMAVQEAESAIDIENSELDEATTNMQGVITKRNNAYTTCTQLQRKTANTASSLISGMSI